MTLLHRSTRTQRLSSEGEVFLLPASCFLPVHSRRRRAGGKVIMQLSLSDTRVNLLQDNFDVAIRMGRLPDSSLASRRLCDLQHIVVAAPAYLARHGLPVSPQVLVRHNCLMWQSPMERLNHWPFVLDGERQEVPVRGSFRSSNGSTLFQMCVGGVGIMRLAEHLAIPAIRSGQLVRCWRTTRRRTTPRSTP